METDPVAGDRPVIWALSGGDPADARQACVLARAVAALAGAAVVAKAVVPRPPWHRLPPRLWAMLWAIIHAREGGWPFSALADRGAGLARPWPDLVIGAGAACAPVVAALRRLGGAGAVQIGNPRMRLSAFDHVVATGNDGLRGANVIETLGPLNDLDAAGLARGAEIWRRRLGHLPRPRVVVLVGGGADPVAVGARGLEALAQGLVRLAVDGAGLIVVPMPGTPRGVADRLADALGSVGGWVWGGVGDPPYPGVLGLADAVVVSGDAVQLASEAAATGRPVLLNRGDRIDAATARFQAGLRAAGIARPFSGEVARWRYRPLHEAARVAPLIAALLPAARNPALGGARARD